MAWSPTARPEPHPFQCPPRRRPPLPEQARIRPEFPDDLRNRELQVAIYPLFLLEVCQRTIHIDHGLFVKPRDAIIRVGHQWIG